MDGRKKIFEVPETEELHEDSSYLVAMGDGTGTKHIKHKNLIERIKEGIAAWVDAKIPVLVNSLMGTEENQAMDARQGPVIDERLNEISGNLPGLQSASFLMLGLGCGCAKYGKVAIITANGKSTKALQNGVWSEDHMLPFEPAFNTAWIGHISDYDQGLIYADINVLHKSIKIRSTVDINIDHLLRFQIMYLCK